MKKILATILLAVFTVSCAQVAVEYGSVNEKVEQAYYSSVSVVDKKGSASGAGTIIYNGIDKNMVVITAAHVVVSFTKKKKDIYVQPLFDGKLRKVVVLKIDEKVDLAVLIAVEKETKAGYCATLAGGHPNLGDVVWAVGAPSGDKGNITKGTLSNFHNDKDDEVFKYRFTAPIFFGNSGGGLFNSKMELVGVVVSIGAVQMGFSTLLVPGAGYAVSIKDIKKIL